ncbi:hypothetical protein IMX26_09135 [Clostridium sp. 'deep sea']|uniref:hypothetical protein n=1 Tax=Clostridium sp. 'deep sea' TaxID=2779445 RepID=UPI00189681FF|nr:hypothetical protein [Clostridium sp. 'deep sea']QOR33671.1 hypothetical protein IMX26_09135 [Clostridium sp. 'deep sea']
MNTFCKYIREAGLMELELYKKYKILARTAPNIRVRRLMCYYAKNSLCKYYCDKKIYERYCLLQ